MDLQQVIKARKSLYKKAQNRARKGHTGPQFEQFIRRVNASAIETIGETEFQHLVAYVFNTGH